MDYPEWLKFVGETCQLVSPQDVCSDEFSDLIGSVQATVDIKHLSSLAKHFRWFSKPKPDIVVNHLNNIVAHFKTVEETLGKRKRNSGMTSDECPENTEDASVGSKYLWQNIPVFRR